MNPLNPYTTFCQYAVIRTRLCQEGALLHEKIKQNKHLTPGATDALVQYFMQEKFLPLLATITAIIKRYSPLLQEDLPPLAEIFAFNISLAEDSRIAKLFLSLIILQNGDPTTLAQTYRDLESGVMDPSRFLSPSCNPILEFEALLTTDPLHARIPPEGFRNFITIYQNLLPNTVIRNSLVRRLCLIRHHFGKQPIPFDRFVKPLDISELDDTKKEAFFSLFRSECSLLILGSVLITLDNMLKAPKGQSHFVETLRAIDPSFPLTNSGRKIRKQLVTDVKSLCTELLDQSLEQFQAGKTLLDPDQLVLKIGQKVISRLEQNGTLLAIGRARFVKFPKVMNGLSVDPNKALLKGFSLVQWTLYFASQLGQSPETITPDTLASLFQERLRQLPALCKSLGISSLLETTPEALETYLADERSAAELRRELYDEWAQSPSPPASASKHHPKKKGRKPPSKSAPQEPSKKETLPSFPRTKKPLCHSPKSPEILSSLDGADWNTVPGPKRRIPPRDQIISIINQERHLDSPSQWTVDPRISRWIEIDFDPDFIRTSDLFADRWPSGAFKYRLLDDQHLRDLYVRHIAGISLRPLLDWTVIVKVYAKPETYTSDATHRKNHQNLSFLGTMTTNPSNPASTPTPVRINLAFNNTDPSSSLLYHMVADRCETFADILTPSPDYSSNTSPEDSPPPQPPSLESQTIPPPQISYNESDDSLIIIQRDRQGEIIVKTVLFPLYPGFLA